MTFDRQQVLSTFLDAATTASKEVIRIYRESDPGVELKGPDNPVTKADRLANALILEALQAKWPGVPIVAEESDPETFKGFEAANSAIFVDPVDGTREFIDKNAEFCVMIGLAEEGRATVGVIVCPALNRTYAAAEGIGAFIVDSEGGLEPIYVSTIMELEYARCAVSRFHRSRSTDTKLGSLGCRELVPMGSCGVKGVRVAAGDIDLYAHPSYGKVMLWDICAPDAIVHAAGGVFTDALGRPFDYRADVSQGMGILAGNERLHAEAAARFIYYEELMWGQQQ